MFTELNKKFLLEFARQSIIARVNNQNLPDFHNSPFEFMEKRGVFVTLLKNNQLRGCVGYIEPIMPVILAVQDNAISSAFHDSRFAPVVFDELRDINIEISVLTIPVLSAYELIIPKKHGVVVKSGVRKATFLPQVWEELTNKEEFLTKLLDKAGLDNLRPNDGKIKYYIYEVESFKEENPNK